MFFRLLAQGKVCWGTADGQPDEADGMPVAVIRRGEHDGLRKYYIEDKMVRIVSVPTDDREGEAWLADIPREDFGAAADALLALLREARGEDCVDIPDGIEGFLDAVHVRNLEAQTDDRTDLHLAFGHPGAPFMGFVVRCRLCPMNPLLDGGRAANLKLEQTGARFSSPAVSKINALEAVSADTVVAERMRMIERLGGVLKYSDVADKVFRCNLLMIDLHFPRMLAEMVRLMHLEGMSRVSELTERIRQINPLKIKDELIQKHGFYEYKVRQFLLALALGMRPAKIFKGYGSAIEGMLLADAEGRLMCYHKMRDGVFADFLYANTRFEKGSSEKDKYGYLERENGSYYFKLNAKIGLLKR